jgi:hypothetical protein
MNYISITNIGKRSIKEDSCAMENGVENKRRRIKYRETYL